MPFLIQFIGAAIFGTVGYLAGGMITIGVGDEVVNTGIFLMMIGALVGFFIGRGIVPLFEDADEVDQHDHAKNGSK